jgi:Tol biopolymer transport system component/DNA-binding winged helix-turn-helix (wHTH) protein
VEPDIRYPRIIRFGVFEIDLESGELRKSGLKQKLTGQPFQVLALLLEYPGKVVTREELQKRIWPDTFVDVDHSLNASINKIREVLGDSAENPRFVETLPRRGYRFIGVIEGLKANGDIVHEQTNSQPVLAATAACALVILVILISVYYRVQHTSNEPGYLAVPFTAYVGLEVACPSFSPDGSQIVFAKSSNNGLKADDFDLYIKVLGSEDLLRLTDHPSRALCGSWSPDGTQIAFYRVDSNGAGLFVIPSIGGPARKLRATNGWWSPIAWAPDGKRIAYVEPEWPDYVPKVHILSLDTLEVAEISHSQNCSSESVPAFSHSGDQLAFTCYQLDLENSLYVVKVYGGTPRLVKKFPAWYRYGGAAWTYGDKELIYSRPVPAPEQGLDEIDLSNGAIKQLPFANASFPIISAKGDKLAFISAASHVDVWRKDLSSPDTPPSKLLFSTYEQRSAVYSPDGRHIAFESTRGGTREIWVSDVEGGHLVRLTNIGDSRTGSPSWSPDSQKIVFDARKNGGPELYIVDITAGVPHKVTTNVPHAAVPTWSRDGQWIYFMSDTPGQEGIYRCPANGGSSILVATSPKGRLLYNGVESIDGTTIYVGMNFVHTKVYAVSRNNLGKAEIVKGMPDVAHCSLWTVAAGGIYFVPADAPTSLSFFDFGTREVRKIFQAEKNFHTGLSLSLDGRSILFSQIQADSNIMLVEHFR